MFTHRFVENCSFPIIDPLLQPQYIATSWFSIFFLQINHELVNQSRNEDDAEGFQESYFILTVLSFMMNDFKQSFVKNNHQAYFKRK